MELINAGINKGLIKFDDERKSIIYIHQNKRRNYSNPEEQVQAETFLKIILVYGYPIERVKQFVSVQVGSSNCEADIIIYDDDTCLEPKIIIECKKPEVSEMEFEQAIEQAFSYAYATPKNIKYIWVTSRIKNQYFEFNKNKKERKDAPDIPQYGVEKLAKYKYAKGGANQNIFEGNMKSGKQKYFELETVTEDELTRRFRQAHQALWAGGELNPSEAFDELDKLIFCKIWDERQPRKNGEPYAFQIFSEDTEEKTRKDLYERMVNLYAEGQQRDPEVFKDNIRLTSQKIKTVVGYLEGINLSATDLDSKGRAFEAFMGSYFRGDFGQFFTPRNIVKFIVEVLPIKNISRVLDTSCGSGGFLLYALDKIRLQSNEFYDLKSIEQYRYWHEFAQKNLFGIEINEQIARTAKMNMIIHDDGHTNVISANGLLPSEELIKKSMNKEFKYDSFDFIITNPPFGSIIKQTENSYMQKYRLAIKEPDWLDLRKNRSKNRLNQSTEIMFIEQCYNFLKPGGYLAIVIPDGILTNSSLQYVRDQIEEWYRIVAVVSMPQDAFAHTGATVKSSVLFLRKFSNKQSEIIVSKKTALQEKIKQAMKYEIFVETIENEKNNILKNHIGFNNNTNLFDRKTIEKTDVFKVWKQEITTEFTQKLSDFKEKLNDAYFCEKQKILENYHIFMAIAEKIGYDATGKTILDNELDTIGIELKRFINHIEETEKI